MKTTNVTERTRWQRTIGAVMAMGLGALLLAILLLGLRGAPAQASLGILYVDGAAGSDTAGCTNPAAPCATIGYALTQAGNGDEIRVAQGVYTENLTINIGVTLEGGYESVGWTRDLTQYETIIDGSNSQTVLGDWDGNSIRSPVVISTGVVFEMWYEGWPTDGSGQLGRATSPDGVAWTKDNGNPLFGPGSPGAWDEGSILGPFILLDDGTYKLWYTADRKPTVHVSAISSAVSSQNLDDQQALAPQGAYPSATGCAASSDGVNWTRCSDPVLEGGSGAAWDRSGPRDPYIVKADVMARSTVDYVYTMWYYSWTDVTGQIGCATSPDGIHWTKCTANPVFGPGDPGDWDESGVIQPVVLFREGMYHMWYRGAGGETWQTTWHIGYATSADGINWIRPADGPVLSGTEGEWDEGSVALGDVTFDGETYHMWYAANGQVGYAWSPDGISWTKSLSNPVLTPGTPTQWGEPVVRFEAGSDGAVLDGFTVTGGSSDEAGGVHAGEADVTIRNCLIRDNFADGSPNTWGGGGVLGGTSLTITDSRIINNEVNQGASGVRVGEGQLTMINTLVADNRGAEGLHLNGGANLMNVTVANNAIGTGRPGVNFNPQTGGNLVVVNSIVYGNGAGDAFHVPDPGTIQASYSDIQGGWSGTGNIDANPSFVDLANGDYHLQAWSPCIDAGTAASAPDHDFEGDPRPQNAGYDMGADEFVGTPIPPALYVAGASGSDTTDCRNRAAPCATIGYALTQAGNGDEIRVAEGTYTENLTITVNVTLEGGYSGPPDWTRSLTLYETIVDGSGSPTAPGDWDGERVRYPMVVHDGDTYEMWYTGIDLYNTGRIGYATSPDGFNWIRYASNPVLDVGVSGDWDLDGLEASFVIKDGPSSYKMWYSGFPDCGIGYATSSDGVAWTKHPGNPVLSPGGDDWNNNCVLHPFVLFEGGLYKMWLLALGDDGSGQAPYMAYATSPDGITWTWGAANPLFARDWEVWFWRPDVLSLGGAYHMWYSLWDGEVRTSYATSPDETTWTKHGSPVLSGTPGEWDEGNTANPFVLYASGTYTMYYDNNHSIGMATSTDGISWTKSLSNPVLTPGTATQWGGPVVRFEGGSDGSVLDGLTITGGDGEVAGGIDASESGDITIRNCLIRDNFGNGMPDHFGAGGVVGGGGGKPLTIVDSRIVNNQVNGGAGGVRSYDGLLVMTNTIVADNHGDMGIHANGPVSLVNTTVTLNDGGVLINAESAVTLSIVNSIVYDTEWSLAVEGTALAEVSYSDVEGGWAGSGNIDADPQFVDATNGDYHLRPGSPAIDAGTNAGAPATDFEGDPRPLDGNLDGTATTDMGADEFSPYRIFLPLVLRNFAGGP